MSNFALAIHGGAGTILKSQMNEEKEQLYADALRKALQKGEEILRKGGNSVEAVEQSVASLEDCPLFNAGRGSVFSNDGINEMEASIMDGSTQNAGAVAGIRNIRNPVGLARKVMDSSEFVYLAGQGAMDFAVEHGVPSADDKYFFDQFRYDQWQEVKDTNDAQLDHSLKKEKKFGTVGAVALDLKGGLAAATSTGGLTNKKYGRVGDSSIIGAGNYANNSTCAVSCTGYGEFFIRGVVAYDVAALMEYKGLSLQDAADHVINKKMVALGGEGGLIAVDQLGNIALPFNSEGMYRGYVSNKLAAKVEIYK